MVFLGRGDHSPYWHVALSSQLSGREGRRRDLILYSFITQHPHKHHGVPYSHSNSSLHSVKHSQPTTVSLNIPPSPAKRTPEKMDIEEWELLPDEGFLEIHDDDGGKKINPKGNTVFHMNYFICPSNVVDSAFQHHPKNQLPPLSIRVLEPRIPKKPPDQESDTPPVEIIKKITPPPILTPDPVSHVFFKKMKETEFVDIKVDSPRSGSTSRGFIPPIEGAAVFQFEEKGTQNAAPCDISEMVIKEDDIEDSKEGDGDGSNIWKWSLTGIGAICSLGVTVCCIIVFRGSCRMSIKHPRQNQKLQSQTHANDKRIKQGVNHASRLSDAVRAMRKVPIAKARITFGGHYDAAI